MSALGLILLMLLAAVFGAAVVKLLTCKLRELTAYSLLTLASIVGITFIASSYTFDILSIVSMVIFFFVGYSLMTFSVMKKKYERVSPKDLELKDTNDNGEGPTAIIYFSHGESPCYDPEGWVLQFQEFDRQGVPFMPMLIRPFFLFALRSRYFRAGKSRHTEMHEKMMRSLEKRFDRPGKHIKFYLSFLDSDPRVDAVVAKAVNEGASRVVVAQVFLTESNHTLEGQHQVKALGLDVRGIDVKFTSPLWNSNELRDSFLKKTESVVLQEERPEVGVVLVGHGQPVEWDAEFPTETEQEDRFRQRVVDLFVENGFRRENVGLAWMSFREPRPQALIEDLAGRGIKKIIFFSAAISADGIHSQCDIPELVGKARVGKDVELIDLGAWNDHPLVIEAIGKRIDEVL